MTEFFTKDRVASKIKQLRYNYRKVLDFEKQSGAVRIVAISYDVGSEIWAGGSRSNESLKSGMENTSGGIKAGENDHYEELSNARSWR